MWAAPLHWRLFAFGVHLSDDPCMACGIFSSVKPALIHFDVLRLVPALILFFTLVLCFFDVHCKRFLVFTGE